METQPQINYEQAIMVAVKVLPIERKAEALNFVLWLQTRISDRLDYSDDVESQPSEEQLKAEDALWDATFARHANKFDALADQALIEIELGQTLPMFDDKGRWLVDDQAEEDFLKLNSRQS